MHIIEKEDEPVKRSHIKTPIPVMALHTEIEEQSELDIVKHTLPSEASHLLSHDPAETMVDPNQSGLYQLIVSENSSKP